MISEPIAVRPAVNFHCGRFNRGAVNTLMLLVSLPFVTFSQEAKLRLLGTNVVDFSLVYKEMHGPTRSDWHHKYIAAGSFERIEAGTLYLEKIETAYQFRSDPSVLRSGLSRDIRHMDMAARLAGGTGIISIWQYRALPPQQTRYFSEFDLVTRVQVRHYDLDPPAALGVRAFVVAWPLATNVFDYGKPFHGDLSSMNVLRLTSNGMFWVKASRTNGMNK